MTGGVIVPWYPRPIIGSAGRLLAARLRSSAAASCSETAAGRSSAPERMALGTAAAIRSSIDA